MRLAVPLAVMLVVAGCVSFPPERVLAPPHCGPTTTAYWIEPGVYDRFGTVSPEPDTQTGYQPSDAGFALPAAEEHWTGATVGMVRWNPTPHLMDEKKLVFELMGRGNDGRTPTLAMYAGVEVSRSAIRAHFERFITNVSSVDETTRDAWFAQLMDERQEGAVRPVNQGERFEVIAWLHTLNGSRPYTLEALFENLGGAQEARTEVRSPWMNWGPWGMLFNLPKRWVNATINDTELSLQADGADGVQMTLERNETAAKELVRLVWAEQDWSPPSFDGWDTQTVVC